MVGVRLWIIVLVLMTIPGVSSNIHVMEISETSGTIKEPIFMWRADPNEFLIEDASIFPKLSLDTSAALLDLSGLGNAWITWTLNFSGNLLGVYGTYSQGEFLTLGAPDEFYNEIVWFGIGNDLIMLGISGISTDVYFILPDGRFITREIDTPTADHKFFTLNRRLYVSAMDLVDQEYYIFTESDFRIETRKSSETILAAGALGFISDAKGVKTLVTETGNTSLPVILSNDLVLGHAGLNPAVFDITRQRLWTPEGEYDFPEVADRISFFGLQSSILIGTEFMYELDTISKTWVVIAEVTDDLLDFAMLDIGLYMGPVRHHGLGLIASGEDSDGDSAPDTLEDYIGTLNYETDSDRDGIDDASEIIYGTNPLVADQHRDYDGDGLSNGEEIRLYLDPLNPDSDYGGALDGWEIDYGLNVTDATDDQEDWDGDGITNAIESRWASDPASSDTDGDGLPDGWEIQNGINPTISNANDDPDGDGKSNWVEYQEGTNPVFAESGRILDGLQREIVIIFLLVAPIGYLLWKKLET